MSSSAPSRGWAGLFWQAFERSSNAMLLLDENRVAVAVNDAALRLLERSRDEVIGSRGDLLIAPNGWKRIESDWNVVLRTGRHSTTQEVLRPDGQRVWVDFAAHRELVTGRQLVLIVVLESRTPPSGKGSLRASSRALTPRELEVVAGIAMGRHTPEIATELHIAPATVRTHVRNAMAKLGTRSQAQLVAIAIAEGILDLEAIDRHVGR